jgi:aquaporin rerated protein, other eukaryote
MNGDSTNTSPKVTLTLWLVGAVPAVRCLVIIVAQILGGISAAAAVSALFPGPLTVNVRLGGGTSIVQGLFIEMFTTCMLAITVIMLAAVKQKATYLAPIGIGIALFIGHLCSKHKRFFSTCGTCDDNSFSAGIYFTGAGINPARAFGPDVVTHSFPGYHWVYWIGPMLGAGLASAFWYLLETLGWKTVNPGQDYDDLETQAVDPRKTTLRPNIYIPVQEHKDQVNMTSSIPPGVPVVSLTPVRGVTNNHEK